MKTQSNNPMDAGRNCDLLIEVVRFPHVACCGSPHVNSIVKTLEKATSHMTDEAASAGFFTSEHFGKFPKIQILTIEELLAGKTLQMPPSLERTFKQAERVETDTTDQRTLGFD